MKTTEAELGELRVRHEFDAALSLIRRVRDDSGPSAASILLDDEIEILLDSGAFDAALSLLTRGYDAQDLGISLKYIEVLIQLGHRDTALDVLRALIKTGDVPVSYSSFLMSFLLDLEKFETFDRLCAKDEIISHPDFQRRLSFVAAHRSVLAETAENELADFAVFARMCRRLGDIDGFRHNFRFADGTTLFDIAAIKENSPVEHPDFNFIEWDEITAFLGTLEGKRVLDVGGADGFFSIEAAKAGGNVTYLDPDHLFLHRAKFFARHFGLEGKIDFKRGLLQRSFLHQNGRYDVVLALGLIYHLDNLALGLRTLMELSDTVVVETTTGAAAWTEDRQAVLFRDKDPLDFDWVVNFFARYGYRCSKSETWTGFVDKYPKSAGRRLVYFSKWRCHKL